ncbi:MAG: hypothetical protein R3F40_18065 [Candidatus Competibacteraceae bacterium]
MNTQTLSYREISAFASAETLDAPLPAPVAEIGKIHLTGNIIPHQWYQHITLGSGKPDLPAITILAEIVYRYRPRQTLDKRGNPLPRKHFDGDMFQCTAAYFESKFGLTKDQTRKALKRLEDAGYIRREYRDIVQQGILRNCVMFIEPVPRMIQAITHPVAATAATPLQAVLPAPVGDPPLACGLPPSPVGDLFKGIKITNRLNHHPKPSITSERPAEPESAGSGHQDEGINAEDCPAPDEREPASDERRPALIYPVKLTQREHEDIVAQVHPLPTQVAQQILDVIQARIQGGTSIRTNPAAVLRGIVRKYHADPSSFDPSSGFHIADQRRQRAEAEARLRRAAEVQRIESAKQAVAHPLPTPRARMEGHRRFVETAMRTLRGG